VLETIIDPSQTAYVPGRSVADNLRSNVFYKNYCSKNNLNAVLISLDAKKHLIQLITNTSKKHYLPMALVLASSRFLKFSTEILLRGF
jgi:hypothetical protein